MNCLCCDPQILVSYICVFEVSLVLTQADVYARIEPLALL